jgi:hypothetical protein
MILVVYFNFRNFFDKLLSQIPRRNDSKIVRLFTIRATFPTEHFTIDPNSPLMLLSPLGHNLIIEHGSVLVRRLHLECSADVKLCLVVEFGFEEGRRQAVVDLWVV